MNKVQNDELKALMKKYVEHTSTGEEWHRLMEMLKSTKGADEMDVLWQEVWNETGSEFKINGLTWDDLLKKDARLHRAKVKKLRTIALRWTAVAALIGVALMVTWWINANEEIIYETGFGENLEIVLDDGSKINLNANSQLVWNTDWEDDGIRYVKLKGEAYFNVAHIDIPKEGQSEHGGLEDLSPLPFEVRTSDLTIRVLGTSFNTLNRRGRTEVFLDEGSVMLSLHRDEIKPGNSMDIVDKSKEEEPNTSPNNGAEIQIVRMKPGEWVSYSSKSDELIQKSSGKLESQITEWKDGTLVYHDVEFRFMLQNLEDIYGKSFEVRDQGLMDKRVNVGVPYKDWVTVTKMMEWMLNIEIIDKGNNLLQIRKKKEK